MFVAILKYNLMCCEVMGFYFSRTLTRILLEAVVLVYQYKFRNTEALEID